MRNLKTIGNINEKNLKRTVKMKHLNQKCYSCSIACQLGEQNTILHTGGIAFMKHA